MSIEQMSATITKFLWFLWRYDFEATQLHTLNIFERKKNIEMGHDGRIDDYNQRHAIIIEWIYQ